MPCPASSDYAEVQCRMLRKISNRSCLVFRLSLLKFFSSRRAETKANASTTREPTFTQELDDVLSNGRARHKISFQCRAAILIAGFTREKRLSSDKKSECVIRLPSMRDNETF
jgi:hypothetical protein